jgi:hypothetical protein
MVTKLIKKEEIPGWEYGDVCIKTFSIGESLKLGNFTTTVQYNGSEAIVGEKPSIDISQMNVYALAAGIQYIKKSDNYEFFIKPGVLTEDKYKIVFDFDYEPGKFLLEKISELNQHLSNEQKKL